MTTFEPNKRIMLSKSIILNKYGQSSKAFTIGEVQLREIKSDEVIIKTQYSGINFADIVARRGLYPDAPKNPAILGYDVSGEVVAKGIDVKHVNIGDKVAALTRFGGYASHVIADQSGVMLLPNGVGMAEATALATQACTAYYCACDCVSLHQGDRVLVQAAAGGVGMILSQLAINAGCEVYGTSSTSKQNTLQDWGVVPVDYTKNGMHELRKKDVKFDVIFDSVGGKVFKQGMSMLQKGGKMVNYGAAEQMKTTKNPFAILPMLLGFGLYSPIVLLMESKAIIGVNMLRIADYKKEKLSFMMQEVSKLAAQKIINPRIDKTFSYVDIAEAHDYVESRQSIGKVVLTWE